MRYRDKGLGFGFGALGVLWDLAKLAESSAFSSWRAEFELCGLGFRV